QVAEQVGFQGGGGEFFAGPDRGGAVEFGVHRDLESRRLRLGGRLRPPAEPQATDQRYVHSAGSGRCGTALNSSSVRRSAVNTNRVNDPLRSRQFNSRAVRSGAS